MTLVQIQFYLAELGRWILQIACRDAASWPAAGIGDLRIGVNLFAQQYRETDLVDEIRGALQSSGLRADLLELEITEDIALEHVERAPQILSELRSLGLGIAFDDFGTGYASLSYLTRYPLTRLKVDRSFIKGLSNEASGTERPIVRSMITLAHNLGLEVIAEGVETEDQVELLRAKGCDELQGYLYGKPMPYGEFVERVMILNGTKAHSPAGRHAADAGKRAIA